MTYSWGSDVRKSKFLSLVLRHQPESIGIQLDANGWVDVDELLQAMARIGKPLSFAELEELVESNDKQRFALSGDCSRIRANQGHSVSVDLALEASAPPEELYHGTVPEYLESIMAQGLMKMRRQHVHLSPGVDFAVRVGGRRGKPIVLMVATGRMHRDGHRFFQTQNGVWLVDAVPPQYLTVFPIAA
ncbi:RNA 2'-phosphotransferase [Verrucomicrobia bacterium LW23]|nr:RNA 2'-phosphotransferase [Verrucomicrobia bacterium LW23]